ncbi:response regulator transcription factor [Fulvivirga sp. M361]|uniref:LytR/AlgR family response regulator transcription factor n=1 Tax=Fulvivirga sp. M361 TaxID=2594266 RepID=UPI001179C713|nr:response regulator [Fulvivirga sp. M361]TRX58211.1 response regulator transcription factor [Fulvivirga sp. M361]
MQKSVLIVEDEPLIADDLSFHLNDLGIQDVKVSLSYDQAQQQLRTSNFDLVLLDINLSGDKDGIDLAHFINQQRPAPFVFVTSYYDAATLGRAKETDPYGYIVKPFDKQEVYVNVEMAFHKIDLKNRTPERFFIREKEGIIPIEPADIQYVEAFDNYAKVFTSDQFHIISHTLKSIENKLLPFGFERIHKSYLINFSRLTRISEGHVYFGEKALPIGRAFKTAFMSKLSML